jgi:hypothetical protein
MTLHLAVIVLGLLTPTALVLVDLRDGTLNRSATFITGGLIGATAGAGVALGLWFQPTTANIESGFAGESIVEWLRLATVGGVLGCAAVLVVLRFMRDRRAGALLVGLAVVGAAGLGIAGSRATIDCDARPAYCSERYAV